MKRYFSLDGVEVGDYVAVRVENKKGDRNLDGAIIKGKVKDLVPKHSMARLESGWCVHTKDVLLEHRSGLEKPTD